ncbi:MAG: MATE family efflux transporter, partial [Gemmatimonadota bacterium]
GAAAAVAGQNLGAGHPDRAAQAPAAAARIGIMATSVVAFFFLTIPRVLLAGFGMTDPAVVEVAVLLLRFLSISGFFITVALSYTGGLQGTGDTRSPFYISLVSQLAIPLGWCAVLQATRGLTPSDIWLAILLGHMTRCGLSVVRFRQGKWRNIAVDIGTTRATS